MATEEDESRSKCRSCLPLRRVVLAVLSFLGFLTNYMIRVNLNIAIVEMSHRQVYTEDNVELVGECVENEHENVTLYIQRNQSEFHWTPSDESSILGSFYWSYILALLPGGYLAHKFGCKLIYGGANLICGILAIATPYVANTNPTGLLVVRIIQGLASGTTWPAMHVMASNWIPPHERSKFVASYFGNAVGIAITYPLCGILIDTYGWRHAFYVPGGVVLIWCLMWWLLVSDDPQTDRYITEEERLYLKRTVVGKNKHEKMNTPWFDIFTSVPFWALVVSHIGSMWIFMLILTYWPYYLKNVYGFNIRANGYLSGIPNITRFLGAILFSWIADDLLSKNKWKTTQVRKFATALTNVIPAIICLILTNVGCDATTQMVLISILMAFGGCASSGPVANSLDLAPNLSGVILGLVSIVSMSSGFLVPIAVTWIVSPDPGSLLLWRHMFILSATISFICCSVYMVYGSGDVQYWNEPKQKEPKKAQNNPVRQLMDEKTEYVSRL